MAEITFGTYEPEKTENPYTDTIAKLIEAGENASATLTVDAVDEKREHSKFAKAANAHDKTARLRVRDDSKIKYGTENGEQVVKGGTVSLTFTLTKRHQARRGPSENTPAEAAAV